MGEEPADLANSDENVKARYARERNMARIPLTLATGEKIDLSPGGQKLLVKEIIERLWA